MNDYLAAYKRTTDYFGDANELMLEYLDRIRPGGRVLDIGVGQGRNALALARAGFQVIGIDTCAEAIDQTRAAARAEGLEIQLEQLDFLDFETVEPLDAILVFGLVQTLTRAECASLFHRIYTWSRQGTILMLSAWHVDDPSYSELSRTWQKAGLHSFRNKSGDHRTFLPKGQIRDIFLQWRVFHYREYLGTLHRHGEGSEHQHGNVDFIAGRK